MESIELILKELGFENKAALAETIVKSPTSTYHFSESDPVKFKARSRSVGSSLSQYLFSSKKLPDNLKNVLITVFSQSQALKNSGNPSERALDFINRIKQAYIEVKPKTHVMLYADLLLRMESTSDIVIFSPNPPELVKEKHNKIFIQVKSYLDMVARLILKISTEVQQGEHPAICFHYYVANQSDAMHLWLSLKAHIVRFINELNFDSNLNPQFEKLLSDGKADGQKVEQMLIGLNERENLNIQFNPHFMGSFSLILLDYLDGYINHGLQEEYVRLNKLSREEILNLKKFELHRMETNGKDLPAKDAFVAELQKMN